MRNMATSGKKKGNSSQIKDNCISFAYSFGKGKNIDFMALAILATYIGKRIAKKTPLILTLEKALTDDKANFFLLRGMRGKSGSKRVVR